MCCIYSLSLLLSRSQNKKNHSLFFSLFKPLLLLAIFLLWYQSSSWSSANTFPFYHVRSSLSVFEYYTSLKSHWEELDNYRPFPECECSAKTYHQQDFIIRFLKGLANGFSVVRSQILLMDPLPPISRVFSMVVQQER